MNSPGTFYYISAVQALPDITSPLRDMQNLQVNVTETDRDRATEGDSVRNGDGRRKGDVEQTTSVAFPSILKKLGVLYM